MKNPKNFSVENEFLLNCIRANSPKDLQESVDKFLKNKDEINWEAFRIDNYKAFFPVYLMAKDNCQGINFPAEIKEKMKLRYVYLARKTKRIKDEAKNLAAAFRKSNVELIFIKGVAYLATIYKHNPEVRDMRDIDILVRKEDLDKAEVILKSNGYTQDYKRVSNDEDKNRDYFSRKHFHYIYFKGDFVLELHWGIEYKTDKDLLDNIFRSTEIALLGQEKIKIMSAENTIIFSFIDSIRDFNITGEKQKREMFLYWLFCLYEIRQNIIYYEKDINWSEIKSAAMVRGKKFDIYSLFFIMQETLQLKFPSNFTEEIKNDFRIKVFRYFIRKISRNDIVRLFLIRGIVGCFFVYKKTLNKKVNWGRRFYKDAMIYLYSYHERIYRLVKKMVRRYKNLVSN
jgi:hypothetical protein